MNILFFLRPKAQVNFLYDDNSVRKGIEKTKAHGYTASPVIDRDGKYVGTITQGDLLWATMDSYDGELKSLEKIKISDIIRKDFNPCVTVETEIDELFERITNQNFVPIVDDRGVFMGIITRKSVIEYLMKNQK